MTPFLDTGFLLTLLLETDGSRTAWEICRAISKPLPISSLQLFTIENRFKREIEGAESSDRIRALAASALQNFRCYLEQDVIQILRLDYEIAIELAAQWQNRAKAAPQGFLLLWPALAATAGATHFLSFDPRCRRFAASAGMELLPLKL